LLRDPLILLVFVIVARFVLEAVGVPLDTTRFLSVSVVYALAEIYVGAVAPLRGVTTLKQLVLPAFVLSAWLGGWTALALGVSGMLQLQGSHFAHTPAPGVLLYPDLWFHIAEHIAIIPVGALPTLGVMSIPYFLHRWPITVAPAAVLGGLVTLRFCRRGDEPCADDCGGAVSDRARESSPLGSCWRRHWCWAGSGGYGYSWRRS